MMNSGRLHADEERIFGEALLLAPSEREAYLDRECRHDRLLARRVRQL